MELHRYSLGDSYLILIPKEQPALQIRLDAYWVLHNFIRPHFTTKLIPAVALGILDQPLSRNEILRIQYIRTDCLNDP